VEAICPRDMRIVAQRTGHLVVNVAGMKDILSLLSSTPRVPCQILHPMIKNYLPGWTGIPAQNSSTSANKFFCFLSSSLILNI
jgi:hypothetical protein